MSKLRSSRRADFFNTNSDFNFRLNNTLNKPPNAFAAEQSETLLKIFKEDKTYVNSSKVNSEPITSLPNISSYSQLPDRIMEKLKTREFSFNLMIIGPSGLGKSTFINSFFSCDIYNDEFRGPSERLDNAKTTHVTTHSYVINENDVKVKLTIIDTPGFGDQINNESCIDPIISEIDQRFDSYMKKELSVERNLRGNGSFNFPSLHLSDDSRVHVCLYFVNPNTHGFSDLDINFLSRLHNKVPIIPIIAKSDTLTIEECSILKQKILHEIKINNLNIYDFKEEPKHLEMSKSSDLKTENLSEFRKKFPFAIVCSDKMIIREDGKKVRGRNYPWGFVEVDNIEHNDFTRLKILLIKAHLEDLVLVTHNKHYESFRRERLAQIRTPSNDLDSGPLYHLEEEKREHKKRLKKLENDMGSVFEQKVNERAEKLREQETKYENESAVIAQRLEEEILRLEEDERRFLEEKTNWESENQHIDFEKKIKLRTLLNLKTRSRSKSSSRTKDHKSFQFSPHPIRLIRKFDKECEKSNSSLEGKVTQVGGRKLNRLASINSYFQKSVVKPQEFNATNSTSLLLSSTLISFMDSFEEQ